MELQKVDTDFEQLAKQETYSDDELGLGELNPTRDEKDFKPPRLTLVQDQTKGYEEVPVGSLVDSITEEIYCAPVKNWKSMNEREDNDPLDYVNAVVFKIWKQRVMFDDNFNIVALSPDNKIVIPSDPTDRNLWGDYFDNNEVMPIEDCKYAKWKNGNPPELQLTYATLLYLQQKPERILSLLFRSTAYKECKEKLVSHVKFSGKPIFNHRFRIKPEERSNEKGDWWVPAIKPVGVIEDEAEYNFAKKRYEDFKTKEVDAGIEDEASEMSGSVVDNDEPMDLDN